MGIDREIITNEDSYAQCMEQLLALRITNVDEREPKGYELESCNDETIEVDGSGWERFCELAESLQLMLDRKDFIATLVGYVPMCFGFSEKAILAQKEALEAKRKLQKQRAEYRHARSIGGTDIEEVEYIPDTFEYNNLGYLIEILNKSLPILRKMKLDRKVAKLIAVMEIEL